MTAVMRYISVIFQVTILTIASATVSAGIISGGTLLDQAGANQLEIWLGQGDQDFTNLWSGTAGASSASWHSAVDGAGPTFSIYDITANGQNYLIGGYTEQDWGGNDFYLQDNASFVFNLTTSLMKPQVDSPLICQSCDILSHNTAFATFGGGHDIHGGTNTLGNGSYATPGYSFGGYLSGNIIDGSTNAINFTVNTLETYSLETAASVPEPGPLLLLALGLICLGIIRHNQH